MMNGEGLARKEYYSDTDLGRNRYRNRNTSEVMFMRSEYDPKERFNMLARTSRNVPDQLPQFSSLSDGRQ
jgi:hypothetical protein